MMIVICFVTCFACTLIGAVGGIGGGVLIKPALDLLLPMDMTAVSFLSSSAVLCMALFSVAQNRLRASGQVLRAPVALPLMAGGTAGGVLGKLCFNRLAMAMNVGETLKIVQNALLMALMFAVLMVVLKRREPASPPARSPLSGFALSLLLGALAAFLGIGGGPLNMLLLTAFYGLSHKESALYSLLVIVCSQTAGIVTALLSLPPVPDAALLAAACVSGVLGGLVGRRVAERVGNAAVRGLYIGALIAIQCVCLLNIARQML